MVEEGVVALPAQDPAHPQQLQEWPDNLQHTSLHLLPVAPLSYVACLQYGVSCHTEIYCSVNRKRYFVMV